MKPHFFIHKLSTGEAITIPWVGIGWICTQNYVQRML